MLGKKNLIFIFLDIHSFSMLFVSIINDDEKETVFYHLYTFVYEKRKMTLVLVCECISCHYSFVFVVLFFFGKPFSGIKIFFKFCHTSTNEENGDFVMQQ